MDAFEHVVAMLLHRQGYWVQTSYKVALTRDDKRNMGLPSCPRWEIDIVAYRPVGNEVLAVECKSFLNSPGISYPSFSGENAKGASTYKLFTNETIRRVVLGRLAQQLQDHKLAGPTPKVQLCLAAAHLRKGHEKSIRQHCESNSWGLFDAEWFSNRFRDLAKCDYENDIAVVAAKLAAGAKLAESNRPHAASSRRTAELAEQGSAQTSYPLGVVLLRRW